MLLSRLSPVCRVRVAVLGAVFSLTLATLMAGAAYACQGHACRSLVDPGAAQAVLDRGGPQVEPVPLAPLPRPTR